MLLGNGDGTFQPQRSYATAATPESVAVGDFSGDGHLDIAVATRSSVTDVFVGKGDGTFPVVTAFSPGGTCVAAADMNGDGKEDLVVLFPPNIVVMYGNGKGKFQGVSDFPASLEAGAVAVGDFNHDGNPDLAVAGNGAVAVLLGDGHRVFQPQTQYPAGRQPFAVAVGDFNGDGNLDIVTESTEQIPGFVSVLPGNGDGTFQPASTSDVGSAIICVVEGDFNGDGKLDLAVSDASGVWMLLGNGDGTFQRRSTIR